MIYVDFTPECGAFMQQAGLAEKLAEAAVNRGRRETVDVRETRLLACQWLPDERIVLVDGDVKCTEPNPASGGDRIESVTARVVLSLRAELPGGRIDPEMDAVDVLAAVAESFGIPLTCDPDEPISTLYSGPGNRDRVVVHSGCIPPPYSLIGSFDARESYCEFVWAFRPDRYLNWMAIESERP